MTIRVNTRRLCEIAKAKHGRFNWLIANGLFPWVPPADKNRTRIWDADDILTVQLYVELVNARATIQRAAAIANAVGAAARAQPDCGIVGYVEDAKGARAHAFADWRELVDWDVDDNNFRTMAIFAITPRRQSIKQEMAA